MPGFGSILNLAYDPRENALLQDLTPFFRLIEKKIQSSGGTIIPDSAMLHPGYAGLESSSWMYYFLFAIMGTVVFKLFVGCGNPCATRTGLLSVRDTGPHLIPDTCSSVRNRVTPRPIY